MTPHRIKITWTKLRQRADRAPHGQKRQRQAELKAFVHQELKKEISECR